MTVKVLMVGLDAADHQLVESFMDAGRLPTLKRLRDRGTRGRLLALPGLGDDAVWTSFATGVGPGEHGRFYHERFEGERMVPHVRGATSHKPFWEDLENRGLKIAVIDVPKSPVGIISKGVVIADWMCHGPDNHEKMTCSPHPLPAEVERLFPKQAIYFCEGIDEGPNETREFVRFHLQRAQLRTDAVCSLLNADSWDFVLAVFAETHCVGHHSWHYQDSDHPAHNGDGANAIENIYSAVDAHLGRLIEAAGAGTAVIVFSLIGMGPNYSGTHLVSELCDRFEGNTVGRVLARLKEVLRSRQKLIPRFVRRAGKSIEARNAAVRRFQVVPVDLPTTAIRHRRVSVDGNGDRALACKQLREELLQLRDPSTKKTLVRDVTVCSEAFAGPHADDFADMLVSWEQTGPISTAYSPKYGMISSQPPPLRTGNHRDGGWFIAAGPGTEPENLQEPVPITEFASLACKFL